MVYKFNEFIQETNFLMKVHKITDSVILNFDWNRYFFLWFGLNLKSRYISESWSFHFNNFFKYMYICLIYMFFQMICFLKILAVD